MVFQASLTRVDAPIDGITGGRISPSGSGSRVIDHIAGSSVGARHLCRIDTRSLFASTALTELTAGLIASKAARTLRMSHRKVGG